MEALSLLEERVNTLVELVYELRAKNAQLTKECAQLNEEYARLAAEKLEMMERLALEKTEYSKVLDKEKEITRVVVDDLIKSIDRLAESASQR